MNKNIKIRNENLKIFLNNLRSDIFFKNFKLKGSSSYGLHLILKKKNSVLFKKILRILNKNLIEFRLGSLGNQIRQPYLKKYKTKYYLKSLKNTDHMHFYSVYIGNHQALDKNKIIRLCNSLNEI